MAATLRGFGPAGNASRSSEPPTAMASLPALSCVDDLAGETVLTACEKTLFGSAESVAAAIAYAGSMITRLVAAGDAATANRNLTPELEALRRAVERDRYGLMAYVLAARDHCTAAACPAFRSLANTKQIASNLDDRAYEGLVVRYSGSWNAPAVAPAMALPGIPPGGAMAALPPGIPAGKPTTADFPSSASTPPVSIMMPEPGAPGSAAPPRQAATPAATAPLPASRPAATQAAAPPPAAKKQPAPKAARAPTPITPSSPPPAPAAAADND
jgi:hypothetical protein